MKGVASPDVSKYHEAISNTIRSICRRRGIVGDLDDIEQHVFLKLLLDARNYSPSRSSWWTFVKREIHWGIADWVRQERLRLDRFPRIESLSTKIEFTALARDDEDWSVVHEIMASLEDIDRDIVRQRMQDVHVQAIGVSCGLTRHQINDRLVKLRSNPMIQELVST